MSSIEMRVVTANPTDDRDLLQEANHRISNHLGLLVAMVQEQANALGRGPEMLSRETVRGILKETSSKIVSVGYLHRRLAEQPNKATFNLCDYLVEANAALISALSLSHRVSLVQRLSANCNVTPEQAQHIGLVLSEIIMNAVKHAHPTGIPVQILLACRRDDDGRLMIEVGDDGVGLPEGAAASGVGFRLIRSLVQTLNADLRIESDPLGLTFMIKLPADIHPIGIAAR